jgi:hypothetical protein
MRPYADAIKQQHNLRCLPPDRDLLPVQAVQRAAIDVAEPEECPGFGLRPLDAECSLRLKKPV